MERWHVECTFRPWCAWTT